MKEYCLAELCQSVSETYRKNASRVVLINTSDVYDGEVLNHSLTDNKDLRGQFKKTFRCNDILFSEIRPANRRMAFVDFSDTEAYIASTKLMVIRANERLIRPKFLYIFLSSQEILDRLQTLAETRSGTFPQITFSTEIAPLSIMLPSLEEQDRILSYYESLSTKIRVNRAINDNLQQQIQSLYDSWFKHFAPFSDSEFVVNELGRMPLCWNVSDIYSIATVIYGAPYSSDLFNTEGNGKPIVRIRDLKEQSLSTFTTEVHPKGYLLQLGDIVVGMDGEFRPYIWGNDEAWLNQRVCVFANKRQQGKAFLLCVLRPLLDYVEKTEVGTTVIHIGKKDFDGFRIVLPPDDVLDRFDAIVEPMYWQIVENLYQNRRLAALRDALLPKLMSGEIDVSEVEF